MNIQNTKIPDVVLIEPTVFGDDRGFFFESFNEHRFAEAMAKQSSLYKTIIPNQRVVYCVACITRYSKRKENWFASYRVKSLM